MQISPGTMSQNCKPVAGESLICCGVMAAAFPRTERLSKSFSRVWHFHPAPFQVSWSINRRLPAHASPSYGTTANVFAADNAVSGDVCYWLARSLWALLSKVVRRKANRPASSQQGCWRESCRDCAICRRFCSSLSHSRSETARALADHNVQASAKLDTIIEQTNGINQALTKTVADQQKQISDLTSKQALMVMGESIGLFAKDPN